jgi:hypothetical protein
MMRAALFTSWIGGLLLGCAGQPAAPVAHPEPARPGKVQSTQSAVPTLSSKPLDCAGKIIPPTGYFHAVGFVPEAQGGPAASAKALAALREKVCQGRCGTLAAEFKIWRQGTGGGQVCAMAVINRRRVAEWRASQNVDGLGAEIDAAAKTLMGALKTRKPKIFVARINDSGAAGGPRARWLLPQLRRAFDAAGAIPVVVRKWDGEAVPRGVDAVVMATLEDRKDQGKPVVDLAIDLLHKVGRAQALRSADPITFPAAAAPAPGTRLPKLPTDKGLAIHFETGEGGVLCAGAKTRLRLKTDADMHVRVFSLYGESGALLIHPAQGGSDTVRANTPVMVGGEEGFEALPVPGTNAERVLVVAAEKAADLGALGAYTSTCRLPAAVARKLHRFEGLPTRARVSADGYRIVEGGACPSLDVQKRAQMERMLAEVPECR